MSAKPQLYGVFPSDPELSPIEFYADSLEEAQETHAAYVNSTLGIITQPESTEG